MMTNGTSGDVNAIDFTKPRQKFAAFEQMTVIAEALAAQTRDVIETLSFRSGVRLGAAAGELTLGVRKPSDERIAWAQQTRADPQAGERLSRPQIYAREALCLAEFADTVKVPLQAFRIGALAIAQSPCETFAETGLMIKDASPFPGNTFTIELANGYNGYLPSRRQHRLGGYETWPARSSYLEREAEQTIRDGLLGLLEQLKDSFP
jgi:hypothetical protein